MKLISLNTWGGRAGKEKLLEFFKTHKDVDIFCLQEILSAPYKHQEGSTLNDMNASDIDEMMHGMQDISALLTNHVAYFRPHYLNNYGLMLLVKKNIKR